MDDELARAQDWQQRRNRRAAHRRRVMVQLHGDADALRALEDDWAPVIPPAQRDRYRQGPI